MMMNLGPVYVLSTLGILQAHLNFVQTGGLFEVVEIAH